MERDFNNLTPEQQEQVRIGERQLTAEATTESEPMKSAIFFLDNVEWYVNYKLVKSENGTAKYVFNYLAEG